MQWRPTFYVVGDLNNFLHLLDAFWKNIAEAMAKENPFEVHISPHSNINVDAVWDDLSYESYTLNESASKVPLGYFEGPPCFGKKVPTFSIEIHNDKEVSVVVTQVYSYRDRFEAHGIQGGRVGATESSKGEYVRLMLRCDHTKSAFKPKCIRNANTNTAFK